MTKIVRALGMMSILMTTSLSPIHAAPAFAQFYPLPSYSAPCTDAWVPGYDDAYGSWVFGYYREDCPVYPAYPTYPGYPPVAADPPCARVWVPGYYDSNGDWIFGNYHEDCTPYGYRR